MNNSGLCVGRVYVPSYVSAGVSEWNAVCTTCCLCNEEGWGYYVLLSVWIIPKLLIYCLKNWVILFYAEFIHMNVCLTG
jgi:hypothetical protein